MELVAGAKMRRAVERAISSRQYAVWAWQMALRLSKSRSVTPDDYLQRFFRPAEPIKRRLVIAFASNRGLCGAYNSNVVRAVIAYVKRVGVDNVDVIAVGKRLVASLSAYGIKPMMAFEKDDQAADAASIAQISQYAYEAFKSDTVQEVVLAYTHFQSALTQQAVVRPLFPFDDTQSVLHDIENMQTRRVIEPTQDIESDQSYVYEPGKRKVLSYLVPRLGEAQLYQALIESNASEHSSRMLAMKNATESAGEMLDELLLQYNRARQAGITNEIAEISAGTAALTS